METTETKSLFDYTLDELGPRYNARRNQIIIEVKHADHRPCLDTLRKLVGKLNRTAVFGLPASHCDFLSYCDQPNGRNALTRLVFQQVNPDEQIVINTETQETKSIAHLRGEPQEFRELKIS